MVFSLRELPYQNQFVPRRTKKKSFTIGITIENVELMYECSSEHLRMGTV